MTATLPLAGGSPSYLAVGGLGPGLFVAELLVAAGLVAAGVAVLAGAGRPSAPTSPFILRIWDRERDLAAGLGWGMRRWVGTRAVAVTICLLIGLYTGIVFILVLLIFAGVFALPWILNGRASSRRLKMERAFAGQLRSLRDRLVTGNQPLDLALRETGRAAGTDLGGVLEPLAGDGPVAERLVAVSRVARSPVVDTACACLLVARSRSTEALVRVLDEVMLEIAEAQLAIQEERIITLTQQRVVAMVMVLLMGGIFAMVLPVGSFHVFYSSLIGQVTLAVVVAMFVGLVALLSVVAKAPKWTRWSVARLAQELESIGG